ncbi:MAG: flippase-like domain-containing protein [Myxococcales bacterium]|nr:flippase-like domain-containing protein [Myxococcales bacterium]
MRVASIAAALGTVPLAVVGLHHLDWRAALAQMTSLSRTTWVLVMVASLSQVLVLATRFWALFPLGARPSWSWGARAFGFGQWVNAFMPGRAGDVLRVVTVGERQRGPTAADATCVILLEKVIDVVTLGVLVLACAPALFLGLAAGALRAALIGGIVLLALGAGLALLWRYRPSTFSRLRGAAAAWGRTARGLLTPARLLTALALGCVAWLAEAWSFALVSGPLGGVHLTMARAIMTLLALNVGIAVPISVANVGAYEAATAAGLVPFGVPLPQALAIGAMHHAVQVITAGLFALAFWLRDRMAKSPAALPAP